VKLLQEAEELLMEEMPVFPLYYYNNVIMESPNLKNVLRHPVGPPDYKEAELAESSRCLDPATVVAGFFCFLVRQEGDPVGSDSETKVGAALRLAPLRRSGPSSGGPGPPAPGAGPRITDAGTGSDICCAMRF